MRSTRARRWGRPLARTARRISSARRRNLPDRRSTCRRDGEGRVFLKSSSASSSFKILIVSWIANSSSARVAVLSAHSAFLVMLHVGVSDRGLPQALRLLLNRLGVRGNLLL